MDDEREQSDNPFVDVMAELRTINAKLDALAAAKPAVSITVQEREYLTVKQAAELFNISERSLYDLKLLQVRRGRSVRFRRSDLERHLRSHRAAA
jgi:excisionase family DNA binding protein